MFVSVYRLSDIHQQLLRENKTSKAILFITFSVISNEREATHSQGSPTVVFNVLELRRKQM